MALYVALASAMVNGTAALGKSVPFLLGACHELGLGAEVTLVPLVVSELKLRWKFEARIPLENTLELVLDPVQYTVKPMVFRLKCLGVTTFVVQKCVHLLFLSKL